MNVQELIVMQVEGKIRCGDASAIAEQFVIFKKQLLYRVKRKVADARFRVEKNRLEKFLTSSK